MKKDKIKLHIDTTNRYKTIIELDLNGKKSRLEKESKSHKDQVVLTLINQILQKNNLSIHDLTGIDANPGPGSFTGIRVGISIAQALRYSLGLTEKSVEPDYSV